MVLAAALPLILPALTPAIADAIRGIVGRVTGGAGALPQTVDEEIRLIEAKAKQTQALAEIDKPAANISPWVADLRASFRYVAAGLILLNAGVLMYTDANPEYVKLAWGAAESSWSFIFGDRMYAYIRKR